MKKWGAEATKLYNDANALLKQIIEEKWLTAKGVIGFWHANSNGKDTITVTDDSLATIELQSLRQQVKKAEVSQIFHNRFYSSKRDRTAGLPRRFCSYYRRNRTTS
jgi:cobalamin-dependent methionine synthase I